MIFIQILLIIILPWIISGFFTPLLPKRGRWYYIGLFNKIKWVINGNTAPAIIPLPWPFRHIQIELTWTEYQKPEEKYQELRGYLNVEKKIGTRTESTNIRHLEEHPIEVEVILNDGYTAILVFDVTLTVFNPWLLIPRSGFLTYVQQEFSDIVSPWAKKEKTIDNIVEVKIEEVEKEITFEHNGIKVNLRQFLDDVKFINFGFCIRELSLKAGIPKESQKVFELKQQAKNEQEQKVVLERTEERRVVERKIFENDATTERDVQTADLKATQDYQVTLIDKLFAGQAKVAEAYKAEVLVLNSSEVYESKAIAGLTSNITGNLVTHKRLAKAIIEKSEGKDKKEVKDGKE